MKEEPVRMEISPTTGYLLGTESEPHIYNHHESRNGGCGIFWAVVIGFILAIYLFG